MSAPYIPKKDADLANFANNFQSLIAASAASYGLVAGDATAITAAQAAWQTLYSASINATTRTPASVGAKDAGRVVLVATLRPYAQRIVNNAGVSNALKIGLGLNPHNNTPTPVPAPLTFPVLSISQSLLHSHVIRYRDNLAAPSVKSEPAGAVAAEIHRIDLATGAPVTSPDMWPVLPPATKSPLIDPTDGVTPGWTSFYAARWVTRKGLLGPFGATISAICT